ncbi:MAG TPA: hypothetical protein VJM31_01255 [Vicinamibacterales bacterium]|nr:hypothetical protein [Vicinamibacterales bacterium]
MKRLVVALIAVVSIGQAAGGQISLEPGDLIRLGEAFRLAREVQAKVWPGWDAAPFGLLMIGADREFLMRRSPVPTGFAPAGYSAILQTEIWSRPRQFDPHLLATFPAFGLPPLIVMGRAEATTKTSTAWVLTLMHEHFHQYQMSDPHYYTATEQLDLSKGDQTGMWMLNYPFPYQRDDVAGPFAALSRQLGGVLSSASGTDRQRFWHAYAEFLATLSEPDRRYLSLQVWQEGVARYVELRVAEVAASAYTPSREFQTLADAEPFSAVAGRMREAILRELETPDLQKQQRVSFYAFGAGLALLLDQENNAWKGKYLKEKFFLERYAGAPSANH